MTSVLIVILNWNGIEDTENCIDSLLDQSFKDFCILVVDNNSQDDSVARLTLLERDSKIILIKNSKNSGFSGGVNIGIKYGIEHNFDTIALFNNDAKADKNWLSGLVESLKDDSSIGIATGLLLDESGHAIDSTGEQYSVWGMPFPRNRKNKRSAAPDSGFVFGASGGASLYRVKMLEDIGIFDSRFFAYYEDTDISFRAQLAGWKVTYQHKAIAYHKRGVTSGKMPGFTVYQNFKNLPLLFWKNVPTKLLFPIGLRFLLLYILIFINSVKNGSGLSALKGFFVSIWYFWTSTIWQRIKIQNNRRVGIEYIQSIIFQDLPPEQAGMRKFRSIFTRKV